MSNKPDNYLFQTKLSFSLFLSYNMLLTCKASIPLTPLLPPPNRNPNSLTNLSVARGESYTPPLPSSRGIGIASINWERNNKRVNMFGTILGQNCKYSEGSHNENCLMYKCICQPSSTQTGPDLMLQLSL